MPGNNAESVRGGPEEDAALLQAVEGGVRNRPGLDGRPQGWTGVGEYLQARGFRTHTFSGLPLTAKEAGTQAKDRYARMKRGEQSDRKAPKPGEKRKWNVCKICFQPAKGHSCTGPPEQPGITKEQLKVAIASVQTTVDGTNAEIVAAFERAVVPEAELYDGPPPTPTGAAPQGPPRTPERPTTPTNTEWVHVPAPQSGGTVGAANEGGNATWMVDPLTNTIVDAPVASTPVNEAPAADVAAEPAAEAAAEAAAAVAAVAAAEAEAEAAAAASTFWNVLGQWAEEAAAVNTGNGVPLWKEYGTF